MINFEVFLIICVCLVPIVALIIVLPKKLSKKETKVEPVKEVVKEETKPVAESEKQEPKEKSERVIDNNAYTADDFKGYLEEKQKNTTKPNRIVHGKDFKDLTFDFPRRTPGYRTLPKAKSMAEQIRDLSPELKALIIAGALDRKEF